MGRSQDSAKARDAHMVPIAGQEELDRLLAASAEQPVVLFKHDFACPTSVHAYWEVAGFPGEIALIDVARQRPLSMEIASRLGVKHESPQVIVVRDGEAVYAASHWDITQEDVKQAVGSEATPESQAAASG